MRREMKPMRMLDLFCGRLGWSKAFLARGWRVTAVDLVRPPDVPEGVEFIEGNVLDLEVLSDGGLCLLGEEYDRGGKPPEREVKHIFGWFDFICASSPCEEFSVHGMKHFHPNPKYPENGIRLFNHTREICEASGVPYVMENVRAAQQFVGRAVHHCGSFYLWGTGVPAVLPEKISKAMWRPNSEHGRNAPGNFAKELLLPKPERKARLATIPPELANCVADYAERICELSTK